MTPPRVAVLGAGANGGAVAADLVHAGLDVTLIDQWPANVRAMRQNGLRVRMPDDDLQVDVRAIDLCEVAAERGVFDIILLMMKAYDTRWACQLIEPLLSPRGVLAGVQNGMTVDVIADVVGSHRTVGCVIEVGGSMFEPGIVERDTKRSDSWFAVGAVDPMARAGADDVATLLSLTGRVEITDDIASAKWMKLVVNAAELVPSAILDLPLAEAVGIPDVRTFMLRAGVEALNLTAGLGLRAHPIFGLDADPGEPELFIGHLLDEITYTYARPHSRTTVLQDWMKGRRSEAEDITGLVVSTADRLGRKAPVNARALDLARYIERGELAAANSNLARLTYGIE